MQRDAFVGDFRRCGNFENEEIRRCFAYAKSSEGFAYLSVCQHRNKLGMEAPKRTLLLGLKEKTVSECTFLDFSRLFK